VVKDRPPDFVRNQFEHHDGVVDTACKSGASDVTGPPSPATWLDDPDDPDDPAHRWLRWP
jgi:hypothetical protein